MMDRLPGTRNAAPNPWTARAITSSRMFGASPQPAEAMANNSYAEQKHSPAAE